ncbi:DUF3105 domain-containing protein [Frigoribacterium salinisoli]
MAEPDRPRPTTPGKGGTQGPSVKQQRDARRQAKLAALKREQARSKRNRVIGITTAAVAGVAVLGLVVTFVVTSGQPRQDPASIDVAGVQTFSDLTANHVTGTVDYEQTPPVGGDHAAVWMNCGVYSEPVPNENAVHDLEHGAVWFTYDPDQVTEQQIDDLRALAPDTYSVVSPYPGMETPMAVSAWGAQLTFDEVDDPAVADFVTKYWKSTNAPEPGAACTGGIDGPGRLS